MAKKKLPSGETRASAYPAEISQLLALARAREQSPSKLFLPVEVLTAASELDRPLSKRLNQLGPNPPFKHISEILFFAAADKSEKVTTRVAALQLIRRSYDLIFGNLYTPGLETSALDGLYNALTVALVSDIKVQRAVMEAIIALGENTPANVVRDFAVSMLQDMSQDNLLYALRNLSNFGPDLISLTNLELCKLVELPKTPVHSNEVLIEFCRILAEMDGKRDDVLSTLFRLTKPEHNSEVRREAISALLRIKPKHSEVDSLIKQLETTQPLIQLLAECGEQGRKMRLYIESNNKSEAKVDSVKKTRKRPAFERDHIFLEWNQKEFLGPKEIMKKWNNMSDRDRKKICPNLPGKILIAVAKQGLRQAKED